MSICNDNLLSIFSMLSIPELETLGQVCKGWTTVSRMNVLWNSFANRFYLKASTDFRESDVRASIRDYVIKIWRVFSQLEKSGFTTFKQYEALSKLKIEKVPNESHVPLLLHFHYYVQEEMHPSTYCSDLDALREKNPELEKALEECFGVIQKKLPKRKASKPFRLFIK